ncbi:protein Z-dependent protease inhibitor [Centroberyx gerrardi]|uniref:protein Z-dependent protease inhibitor n=1 Tax=Centroberyx gerrardi TaxID=166262 RepID=UPI003AAF56EC
MAVQKMKMGFIFILTCMYILTPVYQTQSQSATITDLAFKNMDFAMSLYRKISTYHDKNIFFSPLSISTTFAILAMASDGVTREEILKGLNLDQLEQNGQPELLPNLFQLLHGNITQNGSMELDQSTSLFVQQTFDVEKTFEDQIKKFFNADINNVDFRDTKASIGTINEYIMRKTGNKVTEMITSLDALTKLMLINTIFFQGEWQMPFNPNYTENAPFHIDNYNTVPVPMMFKEDRFYTMEDIRLGAKVLKLPYQEGVAMLILLPNRGVDYTLIDDVISAATFQSWIKKLEKMKLEVNMPKFKMVQSYSLHDLLPDLGVASVFSDSANLTRLSKDRGLKVSEVLHKAVIEVDETGTTAAAATTTGITAFSLPKTFIINRPFFFFIYHEDTTSLLFMGRMIDPTKI